MRKSICYGVVIIATGVCALPVMAQQSTGGGTNIVGGSGNTGYVPVWTSNNKLGDSVMFQSGSNVGVGTTTPGSKLDVSGNINMAGSLWFQGTPIVSMPGGINNNNTAVGVFSISNSSTGVGNTAIGEDTLPSDTSGFYNTATGLEALFMNTTGCCNTADGLSALRNNVNGAENTGLGFQALENNTSGYLNIAVGYNAALNAPGGANGNIHIGSMGSANDNGIIRIGGNTALGDQVAQTAFFAAGIFGTQTGLNNAVPVVIDGNGQLGTINSSRRFKEDIQDMGAASSGLMQLRPVTFRYEQAFDDGSKPVQYGLIAEEVDKIYPDMVVHSADGQIQTVKYQVLDSMLLNEVQRLNRENQQLEERLARLEAALAVQNGSQGK